MMRQDEELWMKKMREALKDYSEPPAPDGWSKLEKELVPVREKRIRPYTWWAVAATLLLAVSGVSLFFMQSPTADDIRHTMTPTLAVTPDVMPETQEPEVRKTEVNPGSQSVVKPYTYLSNASNKEKSVKEAITVIGGGDVKQNGDKPNVEGLDTPSDKTEIVTGDEKQKADQSSGNASDDRRVRPSGKDKLHLPVVSEKKRSSDGKWSVAASFSNGATSASTNQTQDYLSMVDMNSPQSNGLYSNMISVNDKNELVFDGGIAYLKQSATITEIKHKQPISFGLSVRKNLSNGFSVETGVTYTMLSSDGKSVNTSEKVEQKLHYIGVPIRGNWNFIDSKRFTVYLTAGGMVEKCVYGKIAGEKETVKPLQFSLAGGVGGQLNITDRIGLYVEPGVSYFFDDGSDVETIRKENPLNFNLQGGIRFTY